MWYWARKWLTTNCRTSMYKIWWSKKGEITHELLVRRSHFESAGPPGPVDIHQGIEHIVFYTEDLCWIQCYPPRARDWADHHRSIGESLLKKFAFINKHSHGVGFRPGRIADRRWPFRKPQTVHKQQVRCYPGITTLYPKSASNPWAKAPLTASIRIWKWNFFAFYRLYPSCHVVAWRAKSDEITRSCILEMVRSP